MTKTLRAALMSAVAVAAVAPAAYAKEEAAAPATATQESEIFFPQMHDGARLASDLIGANVYDAATPDAQTLGDVNNLVVGPDGAVHAVVIGVGGFLGVGEKNVAVDMSRIQFVTDTGGEGAERLVLATTKETLEAAPEYQLHDGETYTLENVFGETTVDGAQKGLSQMMANATGMTDSADLPTLDPSTVTVEQLSGARVYTMQDEWIGEVNEVMTDDSGKIETAVIDFGGFLGIGEKKVAVDFDQLTFKDDGDNDGDFYVYTAMTKAEMEAAPTFEPTSGAAAGQ